MLDYDHPISELRRINPKLEGGPHLHPDKFIEVVGEETLTAEMVISLVEYAGYKAEIMER